MGQSSTSQQSPQTNYLLSRVWLVDDDEITNLVMSRHIDRNGIGREVNAFEDPELALSTLFTCEKEMLPDLIMLDINMPNIDGWAFLESYAEWSDATGVQIPVFMVSSSIFQKDIQRAMDNPHVKEYIVKPVPGNTLIEAIRKHLLVNS